jgi:hypothetical protein
MLKKSVGPRTGQPEWTMLSGRMNTLQNKETNEKGAPVVVRWREPSMLKLAKNAMIRSRNLASENVDGE